MKKVVKIAIVTSLLSMANSYATPEWKLPFPAGETWQMTRGYNQGTHINYGGNTSDDYYALDFAQNGCASWQKPILAVASGEITSSGYSSSYGNYVLIDHGDGYVSRYAHLDSVSVDKKSVTRGQEIGRAGNTGNVSGSSCSAHPGLHLHFAMYHNGQAYKPEPMDGYTGFTKGRQYISTNSPAPTTISQEICGQDTCIVAAQTFSNGDMVGWYPQGYCNQASKWFTIVEKGGYEGYEPGIELELGDVCICR